MLVLPNTLVRSNETERWSGALAAAAVVRGFGKGGCRIYLAAVVAGYSLINRRLLACYGTGLV